jgi:hypothetical protein
VMATETVIAGLTAMEGSTATWTAMNSMGMKGLTATATAMEGSMATSMEMAINGSTVKEGSTATSTAKKSTIWKGLTAMAKAMEADGGLDNYGNGINNSVIGGGLMAFVPKLSDSMELWRLFGTSCALTYVGLPASFVLRASEHISKARPTL